jgi:hypothetical protein
MHDIHDDIKRLRREVVTDLAHLRINPWRRPLTRRERAAHVVNRFPAVVQSLLRVVRRSF